MLLHNRARALAIVIGGNCAGAQDSWKDFGPINGLNGAGEGAACTLALRDAAGLFRLNRAADLSKTRSKNTRGIARKSLGIARKR